MSAEQNSEMERSSPRRRITEKKIGKNNIPANPMLFPRPTQSHNDDSSFKLQEEWKVKRLRAIGTTQLAFEIAAGSAGMGRQKKDDNFVSDSSTCSKFCFRQLIREVKKFLSQRGLNRTK